MAIVSSWALFPFEIDEVAEIKGDDLAGDCHCRAVAVIRDSLTTEVMPTNSNPASRVSTIVAESVVPSGIVAENGVGDFFPDDCLGIAVVCADEFRANQLLGDNRSGCRDKGISGQPLGNSILGAALEAGVVGEGRSICESRAAVHIRRQPKIIGDHDVVEAIGEQRPIRKLLPWFIAPCPGCPG